MAGDWIKMRGNLWDDPRIGALVDATDSSEATVVGGLYWLWATADQHTEDGLMPGLSLRQLDRKTGIPGFGKALCDIGWLREENQGVCLMKFTEHNGASAKRRSTDAQRKASGRSLSASDADTKRNPDGQDTDDLRQKSELEKEKEKEKEKEDKYQEPYGSVGSADLKCEAPAKHRSSDPQGSMVEEQGAKSPGKQAKPRLPACPKQAIVALYHEVLPELPAVRVMDKSREKVINAIWQWVLTTPKSDGTPRATNSEQALAWIREYFLRARDNDFLMGRGHRSPEHENWRCSIEYLLSSRGMKKVIEETHRTETNHEHQR